MVSPIISDTGLSSKPVTAMSSGTRSLLSRKALMAPMAMLSKVGRLPVLIGKSDDGFCISFESFAYHKLGYRDEYELGPGEIVLVNPDEYRTISPAATR